MIELGQTVRDVVTGLEGVAMARHEYLYGCTRIGVQPREHKDGKLPDWATIDEQQLVVLDVPNVLTLAPRTNAPGGPRDEPARHSAPAR